MPGRTTLFPEGQPGVLYPSLGDLVTYKHPHCEARRGWVRRIFSSGALTVYNTKTRETDRGRESYVVPREILSIDKESRFMEQPEIF